MKSPILAAAVAALALSLPLPALAAEISPTGVLFSDYALPAAGGGFSRFEVTRARVGATAKLDDQIWGKLIYDVTAPGAGLIPAIGLRYGYVALKRSWGTWQLGQQATLFSIPVEETYFPRFIAPSFTEIENIVPLYDTGLAASFGGANWGGAGLQLAYNNGSGLAAETGGTKAYEGMFNWSSGALGVTLYGRNSAVDSTRQGVVGLSYDGGPWTVSADGALSSGPGATPATGSTGIGGSVALGFPNVGGMGVTPWLRGDYFTSNTSLPSAAQDTHVRGIVALEHEYAPGVDMAIDDTYTHYMNAGAAPMGAQDSDVVAVHSQLSF